MPARIRTGFVSNASSSSFIATIAIIKDEEKFQKFEESVGYKYDRLNYEQICKQYGRGDFYDYLSKPNEKYSDCTFVHEYDRCDIDDDEDGDYDVDIDECDFSDKVLALSGIGENEGAEIIDETFYAGRDG